MDNQTQKELSQTFEPFLDKNELEANKFQSMLKLSMIVASSAAVTACLSAFLLISNDGGLIFNTKYTAESIASSLLLMCVALCLIAGIPLLKAISSMASINLPEEELDGETFN